VNDPVFKLPKARISYGVLYNALETLQSGKPYTKPGQDLVEALRFCELQPEEIDTVLNAVYHGINREKAQMILIHAMDELKKFVEHHLQIDYIPSESKVMELINYIRGEQR